MVITFTRRTNVLYYIYKLWDSSINHMDTIKDPGVQINSKFDIQRTVHCDIFL
jgi:hypothetical protein